MHGDNRSTTKTVPVLLALGFSILTIATTAHAGGPPNDDCSDAAPVEDGVTFFNTTGATTDGPPLPFDCDEGYGLDFVNDIWFLYTAPCDGIVTVSLCGSSYDTRLAAYEDGSCPGDLINCNDDDCGLQSELLFGVTREDRYLIRVGGFNGSGSGRMEITCRGDFGSPENDDCEDAIAVGDGTVEFDTTGAGTDGPFLPASCDEGSGREFTGDIWYRYTAPCDGEATVSLCSSDYDTRMAIYDDEPCPGALLACNNDACGLEGLRSEATIAVTAGATYLVRVGGFNERGIGTMVIDCEGDGGCPEDLDGSGVVDFGDIVKVLAVWGPCPGCPEDLDGSGAADFGDIVEILAIWGRAC